jgi:hypothetical protein
MAKIFISHSSRDKEFVKRLAIDLMKVGYDVWLDEWEIKVGECILTGIEGGIEKSDFVIVVLSPDSVESDWVNKEWKAKYWEEVQNKSMAVLPILIEDCKIPILLQTKKYADFRNDYQSGFSLLIKDLCPINRDRFLFRERVLAVRQNLLDLNNLRVSNESKILFGKPLNWENHLERFVEITNFVQETQRIYNEKNAIEIDYIASMITIFKIRNDKLNNHRKYSINTMGWREIIDALSIVADQLLIIDNVISD